MLHRSWAIMLLLVPAIQAQQLAGRIEGSVTDSHGALVPGAGVTATHEETNTVYRATTSQAGVFTLPNVRLGAYSLAAEAPGFRRSVVTDVQVEIGGTASVVIGLQVGAVQEEVTVSAEGSQAIVNTADAEIGAVVDNRRVLELPLDGRNAVELALQQAGVYFERSPDGQGDKLIVHGQRHRSVNTSLDGIDTQDNLNRASSTMVDQPLLPMAAENVQEFRVVTGLASAEYSRGGVQISGVTRSGTNRLRGSLFWFNRNDFFSANEFFNNSARPAVETPPLNRNQFGGRLGGPVFRDKTFFYLGYQQTRQVRATPVNRTVYTAEARQGTFRFLDGLRNTPENTAANPGLIRSVNLLACGGSAAIMLNRDCVDSRFGGANPASLDPFMRDTVFAAMPVPNNFDIGDGLNTGGLRFNARSFTAEHLPSIRLDHRINDSHSLYATFNYVDREIDGDYINSREPQFPSIGPLGARVTHSRGLSLALASTLSPALVNESRIGFLGGENAFLVKQPFGTPFTLDINTLSDPYDPTANTNTRDNRTVHLRNITTHIRGNHQIKAGFEARQRFLHNISFFGVNPYGSITMDDDDNPPGFSAADLQRLAGARAINSNDIELARDMMNNLAGAIGEVFQRYNVSSIDSGFVPGYPEDRTYKNHEFDWFVNDTWRVKSNLAVSLGLRWEYATVPYETRGIALMASGGLAGVYGISGTGGFFNPGVFDGTPCASLGALPLAPTTANATAFIQDCATRYAPATSSNGAPLWKDDRNNFAPVVSLAWDPFKDGRTSVRAGFRISYMQDSFSVVDDNLGNNEGLQVTQSCLTPDGGCVNNPMLLRQVAASGPPVPAAPAFHVPSVRSILDSSTIDFRSFDWNLATPYYNEWTFGISREIGRNWAVEARYVGNRGGGLRRVADYNEVNVRAQDSLTGQTYLDAFVKAKSNLGCNRASGLGARFDDASGAPCITPNPLMGALIAGDAARLRNRAGLITPLDQNATGQFAHRLTQVETSSPSAGQAVVRGGAFWGAVLSGRLPANFFVVNPFVASARAVINDGFSSYHGLELEFRRRFARGFSFQGNYTYGKALADYDGDADALLNDVRPSSVRNPQYSKQEIMPRHQVNANWVYELPFGRGGLAFRRGIGRLVFGEWQLGGLMSWRSGRPLNITSGIGTFHRSDVSDENTVDLTQGVTAGAIRDLARRRNIGDGVFYLDPCLSSFLGGACTDPSAMQGLFALPQPGQLGQLGQTILFGPGRLIVDMSLLKRVRIGERKNFELRWEVFNVLNRANFAAPVLSITSSNFGQITRTVNNPRLMQFALKLNF
jgi:hypothetical protein